MNVRHLSKHHRTARISADRAIATACIARYQAQKKPHIDHLAHLETELLAAVSDGESATVLLTTLLTRHLMSDDRDPAHIRGQALATLFEQIMLERAG